MKYLFIYFCLGHLTQCKAWIGISLELSNYFVLLLLLHDVIITGYDFLLDFFLKKSYYVKHSIIKYNVSCVLKME
jgi:hypothetical protein